jgi:hypothetical protein
MEPIFVQIAATSNNAGSPVLFGLTDTGDIYRQAGAGPWTLIPPPDGVNTVAAKELRIRALRRGNRGI